jgi:hypothetical protein
LANINAKKTGYEETAVGRLLVFMLVKDFVVSGCDNLTDDDLPALTGGIGITWGSNGVTPQVGETCELFTENLDGTGRINIKWLRDNVPVSGENSSTYLLSSDDVGSIISVQIAREGYFGVRNITTKYPILPGNAPILTGSVTIRGILKAGQTITAETSALSGSGTLFFKWYRNFYLISGAASSTYSLTNDDAGKEIQVEVVRFGYYGVAYGTTSGIIEAN